ncbi:trigger factor [Candidatus Berkelbacteria bacterium RIFCSPHIGHO2_12_FULL_36_9]|uniref:Trigger factor n=1 Tax=Candidatus Berkelbacteria bacterium RIFCSPHIGHO2_12_FULL_36_9 TaxID=1797469 RepID=A0A1F5EEW1_9BACT|nr:MAG: trigger factor [Candidatus Berkelbacteria bacterium RIFCSPHIGHO2_12_FULL_36_9]
MRETPKVIKFKYWVYLYLKKIIIGTSVPFFFILSEVERIAKEYKLWYDLLVMEGRTNPANPILREKMKVTRKNLPKSRIKLTIEVEAERTAKFFDSAYKKLAPSVDIKGFRPGQAPKIMTLEAIGTGRYHQTALDLALQETYFAAAKQEKIVPLHQPAVAIKEFSEGKSLIYDAEVDVIPEIKIGDYKKIKVPAGEKKTDFEVKKEEVEKVVEKLRYQSAIFNEISREARKGDRVEIDFDGFIDNVLQENLCSKNHPIILGEGALILGFEKELIGMKKGEEKEFDLDVPNIKDEKPHFAKASRGLRKAHFKVKMIDVKETVLPETDHDFAKKFGQDSMDKLTKAIEKSISDEKKLRSRQELENKVLDELIKDNKMEIPESLIEQEISLRIQGLEQKLGPAYNKYLENIGKKPEDLRHNYRELAEKTVKTGIILGEIARREGIYKHTHNKEEEKEIIRKTIDKLVEYATK